MSSAPTLVARDLVLQGLLPDGFTVREAFVLDPLDEVDRARAPEEESAVADAIERRRREFGTGRRLAKEALAHLGSSVRTIPQGEAGAPLWPRGFVGSVTHCDGYVAAVAGSTDVWASVGIDAEPNKALPEGVLETIALPGELDDVRRATRLDPAVAWDRLLFCLKETTYKAWYPLTQRWLGFEEARIHLESGTTRFRSRLLVPGPTVGGSVVQEFHGRWVSTGDLLVCAASLPRSIDVVPTSLLSRS